MIGSLLLLMAVVQFCFILSIEILSKRETSRAPFRIAQRVRSSANLELAVHESFIVFLAVGLYFFVDESGSALLQDIFPTFESRTYGWVVIVFIVFAINIIRHARFGLVVDDETGMLLALQQLVDESPRPEEGIDNVIQHIKSYPEHYDVETLSLLLNFLSRRIDEVGRLARNRLETNNQT